MLNCQVISNRESVSDHQLGARPKRLKVQPKRLDGFQIYSVSILESQFMKLDAIQWEFPVKALLLHLEICISDCSNHNVYRHLCNNYDKSNQFYDAIPYDSVKKSLNKNQLVKFSDIVSFSDGGTGDLASYKISLCYVDSEYLLGNTFVDLTVKELTTVQRAHY